MITNENIDGSVLQDLFHYALACANRNGSAFASETLSQRLEVANSVYAKLSDFDGTRYDSLLIRFAASQLKHESDLEAAGEELLRMVVDHSNEKGINPETGCKQPTSVTFNMFDLI